MRQYHQGLTDDLRDIPQGLQDKVLERSETPLIPEAEVKNYLRRKGNFDDQDISRFVNSAIRKIENYINQDVANTGSPVKRQIGWVFVGSWVKLPYGPHQTIVEVKKIDDFGNETILGPTEYILEGLSFKTIRFKSWIGGQLQVKYTGGHLPEEALSAIMPVTAVQYKNRGDADQSPITVDQYSGLPLEVMFNLSGIRRY